MSFIPTNFTLSAIRRAHVFTTVALAATFTWAISASAQDEPNPEAPATQVAPAASGVEEETNPVSESVEKSFSPGMNIPFDGSSVEAFEESLETIKSETTASEFTTVQNGLDYLLVYDLGARRDPELLYKRLDGKTPAEMLKMVKWKTGRGGV
jgi:hypothetical protein